MGTRFVLDQGTAGHPFLIDAGHADTVQMHPKVDDP